MNASWPEPDRRGSPGRHRHVIGAISDPDQEASCAGTRHPRQIGWREQPAFRNGDAVIGKRRQHAPTSSEISMSSVAVVDPISGEASGKTLEFRDVMHLDEHIHALPWRRTRAPAPAYRPAPPISRMQSAPRAGFDDLDRVDHEILAQHRQADRAAGRDQIVGPPWNQGVSVRTDRELAPPCS